MKKQCWGHFFSLFFENFGKFRKILTFPDIPRPGPTFPRPGAQECTPTGRQGGGGAMRSIAGVNLRTCSGEHMYRYATRCTERCSPTHRSRDDVYPEPHYRKTFPETFSETPRPPPAGRPRGMKSPYRVGSGLPVWPESGLCP